MLGAKPGVAACINKIESIWNCHGRAVQLVDGDTIKAIKIIRDSSDAAFELTKVIKCPMFSKPQEKNIKYSPKKKWASSRLRREMQQVTLVAQYYAQIVDPSEGHCYKAV